MKTGRSSTHFILYTGGWLYKLSPEDNDLSDELLDRNLIGIEFGIFARETLELNVGIQKLSDQDGKSGPLLLNLNIAIPLSEYLSELASL